MYTVTGIIRRTGDPYQVTVGGPPDPDGWGVCSGSPSVLAMLQSLDGTAASLTPTGPSGVITPDDPIAIYYGLAQHTRILNSAGPVPAVPALPPGAVG